MEKKTAVLLINLGSPDSPRPGDVYRYLTEFLNDPRVIDIGWLWRKMLVNGIIVPFRYRNSARIYSKLWTDNGSPLHYYGQLVQELLQQRFLSDEQRRHSVKVFLAMRYQNPSIENVLENIYKYQPCKLIVIPVFPQYASATTGSVSEKVMKLLSKKWIIPEVTIVPQFYDHPLFVKAFVERGKQFDVKEYDHVLFSYHGLPERHLKKSHDDGNCAGHSCESEINGKNQFCYRATCYATTRAIAEGIGISSKDYTVCFQSRLGRGWMEPFSDQVIRDLGKKGRKRVLVFSPAFIADCLETTIEIGDEYQELFEHSGGEKIQLVSSLNESETWVSALEDIVRQRI
ncbi:MAG: ferrochelatase [Crocinitomicaceae bacterium]|nr:ferrochelatase [Crocinitomicaceae bacterium]